MNKQQDFFESLGMSEDFIEQQEDFPESREVSSVHLNEFLSDHPELFSTESSNPEFGSDN